MNNPVSFLTLINQGKKITDYKQMSQQILFELVYFLSSKCSNKLDFISYMYQPVDFPVSAFWQVVLAACYKKFPLERITGQTSFYHRQFQVHPKVFIPRHETELVVKVLITQIHRLITSLPQPAKPWQYIDLCTGTGIIGLSVQHEYSNQLDTTLLDLNPDAIANAQANAQLHQLQVNLMTADWLDFLTTNPTYQIISANFPYVGYTDIIDTNLVKHEPHLALFANDYGWEHYQTLLTYLTSNSHWRLVVLETSSLHQIQWTIAQQNHPEWDFELINDWNNQLRVVCLKPKLQ
ncbi:HemK-like putative methylase [Mycoplasmoides fastidiosum]|uniref:peptide chain release factor N(5)-glutamine methyltransferase n=1 Tax=Mycoplasmoides fastidiosum TaxID=92758 RepID=A0ABU0M033_9BACT|nr:HemK family protein methyltransferase [Mycoplasmoides fastidiosum]MDQ0514306.1 HemK-like putative methylase [Mycoplasmoides fastidiosum]UUD38090.1 HemK family protein methyltransferase [Mycoplasmoides fastidiosum]